MSIRVSFKRFVGVGHGTPRGASPTPQRQMCISPMDSPGLSGRDPLSIEASECDRVRFFLNGFTQSFDRLCVKIVFGGRKSVQHEHRLAVQLNDFCSHASPSGAVGYNPYNEEKL
jgi:hypothetical protein